MNYKNLEELIAVIAKLRSPEGCPWDREQTHASLRPNMIEEAYEAVDAIDDNDMKHLQEELGDVLLQVLLHSQIASENGSFTIEDVAKELKDKLIHRHPHVFGDAQIDSPDGVVEAWEKLKAEEKSPSYNSTQSYSSYSSIQNAAVNIDTSKWYTFQVPEIPEIDNSIFDNELDVDFDTTKLLIEAIIP